MLLLPVLPIIIAWNVVAGLCIAPVNPLADTVMQERIPVAMRAKVFGSMSAGVPVPPRHSIHSGFMTQTNLYSREGQAQGPRPPRHPPPVPTENNRFPDVSLKSAAEKSHPTEV